MSTNGRIALCRIAFLILCVLPTVAVAVVIARTESKDIWEKQLKAELGLSVSIQSVRRSRPGVVLLSGVQIRDPEIGLLAEIDQAEVAYHDQGLVVVASQVKLRKSQLHQIHRLLQDRVLRRWEKTSGVVAIRTNELYLTSAKAEPVEKFTDAVCKISPTKEGCRIALSFRSPDSETGESVQCLAERKRSASTPPSTAWMIKTGGAAIRCSVLGETIPAVCYLGHNCRFNGMIWVELTSDGVNGDVNGRFINVDLDQIVSGQFPHKMEGIAQLDLKRARFQNGRLVDAAGSLECPQGVIGSELLAAASENLRMRSPERSFAEARNFRNLNISFNINQRELAIRGQADNRGSVLHDAMQQPLLIEAAFPTVDVLALVRVLVPSSSYQVPLTDQTAPLIGIFPLPVAEQNRHSMR